MKRQFKHIPTNKIYEEIGDSLRFKNSQFNLPLFLKDGKDWVEITKPEYTILSFKYKSNDNIWKLQENGTYNLNNTYSFNKSSFTTTFYSIYSVRRKSDGLILTVGDKTRNYHIKSFEIINNQMVVNMDLGTKKDLLCDMPLPQKVEKLFTTEDGVDIFEGKEVFVIHPTTLNTIVGITTIEYSSYKGWLFFSTKKALEEYILMNKPCLSFNEVLKLKDEHYLQIGVLRTTSFWIQLKELVKTKL